MQPLLILQLLLLLAVANGTPILAKRLLGDRLDRPVDGGAIFTDGRPWFGSSKTIRGIVVSLLATAVASSLIGLPWRLGAIVAAAAMAGDLLSSFVKRRMGLPPSSKATGLDQIPEALLPLAASRLVVAVSVADIAAGTIIAFAGGIILSRILFALGLRDQPY
jgi:CDP-2,3-bis-(O-geranylgeranyl)-sn-glycerol synthase